MSYVHKQDFAANQAYNVVTAIIIQVKTIATQLEWNTETDAGGESQQPKPAVRE
jgi:hypothetical protein